MLNPKIKPASPVVPVGATKIPVFGEVYSGRAIFLGYVIEQAAAVKKAA